VTVIKLRVMFILGSFRWAFIDLSHLFQNVVEHTPNRVIFIVRVYVFCGLYYLRQVNEVNGGDNAFVRCVSVCVCVCAAAGHGS